MKRSVAEVSEVLGVAGADDALVWRKFLTTIDYKPGWQFALMDDRIPRGVIAVRFRMLVWDAFEQRDLKPIMVTTDYQVPISLLHDRFSEPMARQWIRECIRLVERHEIDEWLRFNGTQVFNPHGEPQELGRRPEGWEWLAPPEVAIAPTLEARPNG